MSGIVIYWQWNSFPGGNKYLYLPYQKKKKSARENPKCGSTTFCLWEPMRFLNLSSEHGWGVTLSTVHGLKAAILPKSVTHSSMDDNDPTAERQTPPFSYYFMMSKF